MAIVAVARDLADLRARLGAITVGATFEGEPVTAEQLGAAGSMAVLLKDALKPNLVQTLEGRPALVHCGPFANIAHGNNSLVADLLGLKLADYVVTESGFGADMGFEKFIDIVCRPGGLAPSAVVLVATMQALRHHGGDPRAASRRSSAASRTSRRTCGSSRRSGSERRRRQPLPRRLGARDRRRAPPRARARRARGGGQRGLRARRRRARSSSPRPWSRRRPRPADAAYLYSLADPIEREDRGDRDAAPTAPPASSCRRWRAPRRSGSRQPVSAAPGLHGEDAPLALARPGARSARRRASRCPCASCAPTRAPAGSSPLCGDMQTMPGLPAEPAAVRIDVDASGRILGLR